MSFQALITFLDNDEEYLKIHTRPEVEAYNMVLNSISDLLSLLNTCNHKFDDDVINRLQFRMEELRQNSKEEK